MSFVTYCARLASAASDPGRAGANAHRQAGEAFDRLLDNLVEQGGFTLRQLQTEQQRNSREVRALLDAGLLRHRAEDAGASAGGLELTPRALQACEERLLVELLRQGGGGWAFGRHDRGGAAHFAEAGDEPRPHRPGDPLGSLDMTATLQNALGRGLPLRPHADDLVVLPAQTAGRCATVLLLDLSGSMVRHGKFAAARRVALALRALVRRRFPGDELFTAGFATRAEVLPGAALLEVRPRDVGLFDPRQDAFRVAADAAEVPGHFTNIQDGLRLARRLLRSSANQGKQILLITDGEPTAHREGDELVLAYPATAATRQHTLLEAARCAREGVAVHVFGLLSPFSPPGLDLFVEQLARSGRGRPVCCSPRQLGSCIVTTFTRSRSAQG